MASTFKDTPEGHNSLTFVTPPMVENTEVCSPMVFNLYALTTDTEVLWAGTDPQLAEDAVMTDDTDTYERNSRQQYEQ
jgi:hypothetical protein